MHKFKQLYEKLLMRSWGRDLEKYIVTHHPKSVADIENLERRYMQKQIYNRGFKS